MGSRGDAPVRAPEQRGWRDLGGWGAWLVLSVLVAGVLQLAGARTGFAYDGEASPPMASVMPLDQASPAQASGAITRSTRAAPARDGDDAATVARSSAHEIIAAEVDSTRLSDVLEGSTPPSVVVRGTSTTAGLICSAPQSAGARFVAGADGVVDTLGGNPNAIVLGKYPAYVNQGAATGARTFSIADDAWNAMSPAEQWLRNQRFLDGAIARGSEIQLATRLTPSNLTGWFAREIEYLTKQGYVPNAAGTHMIPGG